MSRVLRPLFGAFPCPPGPHPVHLLTARHSQEGHIVPLCRERHRRHSYATHLMEAGVHLRLIQDNLGHNSPKTTAVYTHLTREVRDTQTDPLNELMKDL